MFPPSSKGKGTQSFLPGSHLITRKFLYTFSGPVSLKSRCDRVWIMWASSYRRFLGLHTLCFMYLLHRQALFSVLIVLKELSLKDYDSMPVWPKTREHILSINVAIVNTVLGPKCLTNGSVERLLKKKKKRPLIRLDTLSIQVTIFLCISMSTSWAWRPVNYVHRYAHKTSLFISSLARELDFHSLFSIQYPPQPLQFIFCPL